MSRFVNRLVPDTTTDDQRAYYAVVNHMIAEAKRPIDYDEMTERLKELRAEQRRVAGYLAVGRAKWPEEVTRRLRELRDDITTALNLLGEE
jgi:hypothetical protein